MRGWGREVYAETHIVDFFFFFLDFLFVFNVNNPRGVGVTNARPTESCSSNARTAPPATLGESSLQRFPKPHFPDCSPDSGNPRAFGGREPDPGQAEGRAHTRRDAYTHAGPEAVLPGMEDPGWLDGDLGGCA